MKKILIIAASFIATAYATEDNLQGSGDNLLRQRIKSLVAFNDDLLKENNDLVETNTALEEEKTALEEKNKAPENEKAFISNQCDRYQSDYKAIEGTNFSLITEMELLKGKNRDLTGQSNNIESISSQINALRIEKDDLLADKETLEKKYDELARQRVGHDVSSQENKAVQGNHQEIDKLKNENHDLQTRHSKLEAEHANLQRKNKSLEASHTMLTQQKDHLNTRYINSVEQNLKVHEEKSALKRENLELQTQHDKITGEFNGLKNANTQLRYISTISGGIIGGLSGDIVFRNFIAPKLKAIFSKNLDNADVESTAKALRVKMNLARAGADLLFIGAGAALGSFIAGLIG